MRTKQSGFTIAELMIVVVVAAILAALAVPNMSEVIKNNARATRVNTMVTALNYARAEAVTRNARVSMCRSNIGLNFASCTAPATNPGEFNEGWIVFIDGGARGVVNAPDDRVLRIFQPDMGGTANLFGGNNDGDVNGVSYRNSGLADDITGGSLLTAGTSFLYCDDRGSERARSILLTTSGHVTLSRDDDGDGTDDDLDGNNLVCP